MTEILAHDLSLCKTEIFLTTMALLIQMLSFTGRGARIIGFLSVITITFAILLTPIMEYTEAFNNTFVMGQGMTVFKILILGFGLLVMISYLGYVKAINEAPKSEYIVMLLLSLVGGCVTISASSLIVLFMGLELQSLIGYILAGFNRDNVNSSEAGLKYFVLGSLASCLILLGMSFLYGYSGSVLYDNIASAPLNTGIMAGFILLLSGLMFKMSAAPFHMWTPDVYEGAPIISVMFFASVQKIVILCVLMYFIIMRLSIEPFTIYIKVIAILSMLVGSIGGLMQESFKRLLAYSTILNIGFVLIPLSFLKTTGFTSLIYLIIYSFSTLGLLTLIIMSLGIKSNSANLSDLRSLSQSHKVLAALISIFVFSLIGLPPFAGFFGKYMVLYSAIEHEEYLLAATGLLSSLIAAFYYLRIIKAMYFEKGEPITAPKNNKSLCSVVFISVTFTLLYGLVN